MRLLTTLLVTLLGLVVFVFYRNDKITAGSKANAFVKLPVTDTRSIVNRLQARAFEAKACTKKLGFNRNYCFLIDMKIPSGQRRFFIYDLQKDSVIKAGLVTNGSGNKGWPDTTVFPICRAATALL